MRKRKSVGFARERFRFRFTPWVLVPFALSFAWVLCLFLAPYSVPANSLDLGNEGVVGGHEHDAAFANMNGFAGFVYASGDFNCHQKASRSLFLNGNQMPYCARDFGIFLGIAMGLLFFTFIAVRIAWWWLLLGLVPIGIDGSLQLVTSYESNNPLRVATGLIAGFVTAYAIAFLTSEIASLAGTWRELRNDARPSLVAGGEAESSHRDKGRTGHDTSDEKFRHMVPGIISGSSSNGTEHERE